MELQRGVVGDLSSFPALADEVQRVGVVANTARLLAAARRAGVAVDPLHGRIPRRPAGLPGQRPAHDGDASPARTSAGGHRRRRARSPNSEHEPSDLVSHRRHGVSPFIGTTLDPTLRALGVSTVVATGVSLNLGIIGLTVEAVNLGYRVVVATDAVAGIPADYADEVVRHTLGLVATVATVDEIIDDVHSPEREPPPAAPTPGGPRVAQGRRPDRAPALARTRRWRRRRSPPRDETRGWLSERVRDASVRCPDRRRHPNGVSPGGDARR